jgi:hypothetical protein
MQQIMQVDTKNYVLQVWSIVAIHGIMMVVLFLTDYMKMAYLSSLKMALSMILLLLLILFLEALLWNFPYNIYQNYYNT